MSMSVWANYEVMTEKGWSPLGDSDINLHPLYRVFDGFAEHDVLAIMDDDDKSFTSAKKKDMESFWFAMRQHELTRGADVLLRKYYKAEKKRMTDEEREELSLLKIGAHILIAMSYEAEVMCEKRDMWCVSGNDVRVMFFKC